MKNMLPVLTAGGVAVLAAAFVVGGKVFTDDDRAASGKAGDVAGISYTRGGGPAIGVADDGGKYADDGGATFFPQLAELGLVENRITVRWDPSQPDTITEKGFLDRSLPRAQAAGVRVVFSIYPTKARGVTDMPNGAEKFAAFVGQVAREYPQVRDYVIGNEPNQPRFWQPQYNADGSGASARAFLDVLARSYDMLKSVDPSMNVIGVGLSPRGNDNANAKDNVSTSPVRFLRDLGAAYRASGRTKPIMDTLGFHPYPNSPRDSLSKGYSWPNVGVANLDRIKQAVADAFQGTAQPTFSDSLTLHLDEVGWQVGIVPSAASAYTGRENVAVTDEATQAQIYGQVIRQLACDSDVSGILFFGFGDESDLDRFQAGLVRADGSRRPAYEAVRSAITQTAGGCTGQPVRWKPATTVLGADVDFGKLGVRPAGQTAWNFRATATEDATFTAAVVRLAGPSLSAGARSTITRSLTAAGAKYPLVESGLVKANFEPLVRFDAKRLAPGFYAYAVKLSAAMNPDRTATFVSRPFRVGVAGAPAKGGPPKPKAKAKAKAKAKPAAQKRKS